MDGGYRSIYIDANSVFTGYIENNGSMNTYERSVYNESTSMIDYRGSGVMSGVHTMGCVEFSNMDRSPIWNITGAGGVTYSNKGGATTIHLNVPPS